MKKRLNRAKRSSGKTAIPAKGKATRVQAQSLLIGDEFLMNGVPNATVTGYTRGKKETSFVLKIPGKKKAIVKTLANTKRVLINDVPESHARRRELSRMPVSERFEADNRRIDV